MKDKIFAYSKDRPFYINLIFCVLSFLGLILITFIFYYMFHSFIKNETICDILSDLSFIILLILMYFKDLNKEFDTFIKNFKKNIGKMFKYYGIGVLGMIFFNLLIMILLKNISSNESQVREMLFSNTFIALINISIIAPVMEELVFRKSLQPVIKYKWVYVIVSGLLFGGAHILTNIFNDIFVISDLLYVLPYACLGGSFALMDYEIKSTFPSICIHFLHNTFTAILLLVAL